ncbi:MAG: fluoride efflux transporter FluC, partial [Dehalococcoidia bacterium]
MIWLLVALGGAAGSVLRYGAGQLAVHYLGPGSVMGTFAVNVSGSFLLGFFLTLALDKIAVPVDLRGLITVGFLG